MHQQVLQGQIADEQEELKEEQAEDNSNGLEDSKQDNLEQAKRTNNQQSPSKHSIVQDGNYQ